MNNLKFPESWDQAKKDTKQDLKIDGFGLIDTVYTIKHGIIGYPEFIGLCNKLMAERYEAEIDVLTEKTLHREDLIHKKEQRIAELENILIGIDFRETKAKLQELEKLIQQAKELLK